MLEPEAAVQLEDQPDRADGTDHTTHGRALQPTQGVHETGDSVCGSAGRMNGDEAVISASTKLRVVKQASEQRVHSLIVPLAQADKDACIRQPRLEMNPRHSRGACAQIPSYLRIAEA